MNSWDNIRSHPVHRRTPLEQIQRQLRLLLGWVRRHWNFSIRDPKNIVRIPTLYRGHWIDADLRLLHAAFTLLVEYVEKEQGGVSDYQKYIDELNAEPGNCRGQVEAEKELLFLYQWWKQQNYEDWEGSRRETYTKNTQMLIRLCRARGRMWT